MKRVLLILAAGLLLASGSTSAQTVLGPGVGSGRTVFHQTEDLTLYSDTVYTLTGLFFIDSTVTLTIQPGTVIKGDTAATLIIYRGGKIYANGTASQPIVFTSLKAPGFRAPGDWGGIIILGSAPTNQVNPLIEGGIIPGSYGGNNPNDNSGIFRYVRIEYPGYRFQLNNEVNGLTLGGVGRGTTIEYVQVSYSDDDSYEWFGGTVDCKHLVAFGGTDDIFDTDFGYQGRIQYGFSVRDPLFDDPTGESNGWESDNEGSASYKTPRTAPIFSNITMVGPGRTNAVAAALPSTHRYQYAIVARRGSQMSVHNSLIGGYPGGFSMRDHQTQTSAAGDTLKFRNNTFADSTLGGNLFWTTHNSGSSAAGFNLNTWIQTGAYANSGVNVTSPQLMSTLNFVNMSSLNAPDPRPAAATAATSYAGMDSFFDNVAYRGAFDPTKSLSQQWTAGWTNYDPQNTVYTSGIPAPTVVLGPGLNSGRTVYHQNWNRTLHSDTVYTLTGLYFVDSTYTLTIEPGTVIKGDTAATLIVYRGGQIFASGDAGNPIVFTSLKAKGSRAPGDWGGIIILGSAPTNQVNPLIEGGIIPGSYGGANANDNSGVFRYVRIEYPGYRFQLNNEVNGLTMGGVGRGTTIEYVQVSYSDDDSFEWFGGTVDSKYLVAFGGTDDIFDTDFGYQGRVQYGFSVRDPLFDDPTGESNGWESDNEGSASYKTPRTAPIFSNITMVGPGRTNAVAAALPGTHRYQYAIVARRGSQMSVHNSLIGGYPGGFSMRDHQTQTSAAGDTLQFRNNTFADSTLGGNLFWTTHNSGSSAAGFNLNTWIQTGAFANSGVNVASPQLVSALNLTDMSNLNNPNAVPAAATAATSFTGMPSFFQNVAYRGAFDPAKSRDQQWDAGWSQYDSQNYTTGTLFPNTSMTSLLGTWNLVSLPRDSYNKSVDNLFPSRNGSLFEFTGAGYTAVTTVTPGKGYWVFYGSPNSEIAVGDCVESASVTTTGAQWVLIGGLCYASPTSNVTTTGAGSISGSFFEYNGAGYTSVTSLQPGKAYWVFVTGACTITIN